MNDQVVESICPGNHKIVGVSSVVSVVVLFYSNQQVCKREANQLYLQPLPSSLSEIPRTFKVLKERQGRQFSLKSETNEQASESVIKHV